MLAALALLRDTDDRVVMVDRDRRLGSVAPNRPDGRRTRPASRSAAETGGHQPLPPGPAAPRRRDGENRVVDASTLHHAARRYLIERYDELCRAYAKLPQRRGSDGYSLRARRIFPRYKLVQAILVEVERLDPDNPPDLPGLAAALDRATGRAQSSSTEHLDGAVELEAVAQESALFDSAVRTWLSVPDLDVEPLGYRRVLDADESSTWRTRLAKRWGVQGSSWHPMLAEPVPPDVLVLTDAAMQSRQGIARIRDALRKLGVERVVELREYGADYLLDLDLFVPTYNFAEGVWTDDSLDWIAFASHEGTLAFGGLMAGTLPTLWKNLDDWRWRGW